jgi:AbrB family looped-hinge helix DNA binding protein
MTTVTLSTKYQVVVPKEVRRRLNLRPGKKYQVFAYGDRIEFIPVRKVQDMRGVLKGIDTHIEREQDRL